MRKFLKARKVKDGYVVEITKSFIVSCNSDLIRLCKQEGLLITRSDDGDVYAD